MLYHYQTGIPFKLNLPKIIRLFYSHHAKVAAMSDRYGIINLETHFNTEGAKVIELETNEAGEPIKVVVRRHHDTETDVCVVIALDRKTDDGLMVKTVWLNLKTDTHNTLNHAKYKRAG